jgi:adenine-specific DNA methylase
MMVRRLIETDEMPIGVISEHSRKDQNIRKGHLHTLHVW